MNSLLIQIPFSVLKNPQNPFCSIYTDPVPGISNCAMDWICTLLFTRIHLKISFIFFAVWVAWTEKACSQEWVQRLCNHSADCCRNVVTFQETPQAILYLLTISTTKMERYSCCKPFCLVIGTLTISVGCGRHFWLSCLHIGSDGF